MSKRGFTLIELLAVIVILGVILIIAVPKISESIEISKKEAFIESEKELVRATESFIVQNVKYIPKDIGDTKEIKLSDLQAKRLINAVVNPKDNNKTCNGYVLVTKITEKKYEYVPHLNCDKNIGSSSDDGLAGHYTFDDLAESTTNLLTNPLNFNWNYWPSTTYGWNVTKQVLASDYDSDGQMTKFTITAGTTANASYLQVYSANNSITSGKTYGLSFYAKAKVGRKINVSMIKNGSPYTTYVTGVTTIDVTTKWQRFEIPFTSNYTATDARIQLSTGYDLWNDELYIYKPQLEERAPTPFVNGTRLGVVKDHSLNENSNTLQPDSSPKWISGNIGSGAYQFNGTSSKIELLHNSAYNFGTAPFSISFWMNYKGSTTVNSLLGTIISKTPSNVNNPGFFIGITTYGGDGSNYGITASTTNGAWGTGTSEHTGAYLPNTWYYVTVVRNGSQILIYQNGVLKHTETKTSISSDINNSTNISIGNGPWGYINANLDDIRIYNRALTDDEIKYYYDIESYKLNK
jgi:type IV pilus assembly protein PilA